MTDTTAADGYSRALRRHYDQVSLRLRGEPERRRINPIIIEIRKRSLKARKTRTADIPESPPHVDIGEWRVVPTLPQYMVSDLGDVKHVNSGRPRKRQYNTSGYAIMSYRMFGLHQCCAVHTMIAEAFLGPKPKGAWIIFRDGDRSNIRASNLYYGSPSQAERAKRDRGTDTRGERNGAAKITREIAACIRSLKGSITYRALAEKFGISKTEVYNIIRRKRWA